MGAGVANPRKMPGPWYERFAIMLFTRVIFPPAILMSLQFTSDVFFSSFISFLSTRVAWGLLVGIVMFAPMSSAQAASSGAAHSNRLALSHSPYLLLHADNPVDWYPWGPQAIARAKAENKPIFLSVGYSTCYWCHVAERTLYSDPNIAKLMNQWFINIKVDREQRPDLDQIYIVAQQLIAGTSGWPNNVFLTPDLKPFFAGSYFPPVTDARSRGFPQVLASIRRAWTSKRAAALSYAETVHSAMRQLQLAQDKDAAPVPITPGDWLDKARQDTLQRFDRRHGGLAVAGSTTRFPQSPALEMLLADYGRMREPQMLRALRATLDAMAYGGIRDHIGGGFHRYATDSAWSLPHFEKMLYDNAQLLRLYAQSFKSFGVPLYRAVAQDIGRYLVEQMMAPQGGFYTAEDAQVEGIEGASYLWPRHDIEQILGAASAARFFATYQLTPMETPQGPGVQSLQAPDAAAPGVLRVRLPIADTLARAGHDEPVAMLRSLQAMRVRLLAERNSRPQPLRDETINVDLNGLAIEAFVIAGASLARPAYLDYAKRAAERIWRDAYDPGKRQLAHQIYRGRTGDEGFLADYALLGRALLSLYDATGDSMWRERATALASAIVNRFLEADGGLTMTTAPSYLSLTARDAGDEVYPSGTSATLDLWLRLAAMDGGAPFAGPAQRLLRRHASEFARRPDRWASAVAAVNTAQARALIAGFTPARAVQSVATSGDRPRADIRASGTAAHVRIAGAVRASATTVAVTLQIDAGYHVNANPASEDYLIATALSFEGLGPVRIAYPQAVPFKPSFVKTAIDVYEHTPVVVATFAAGALDDTRVLRGSVHVQACNDQICLPPSKLAVSIPLAE
jgi:uncharacterized protein